MTQLRLFPPALVRHPQHDWFTPWWNKPWSECRRCGLLRALSTKRRPCEVSA